MLECSTGELLGKAVFMHHDDEEEKALKFYAVFNRLIRAKYCNISCSVVDNITDNIPPASTTVDDVLQ